MYSEPYAIYYRVCYILLYMLYTLYYANRQVLHSACVSKNSFIVCVHAVVPPDTHGEVRMQQGPKRRMRIQGLFHARSCVIVLAHVRRHVSVMHLCVRCSDGYACAGVRVGVGVGVSVRARVRARVRVDMRARIRVRVPSL